MQEKWKFFFPRRGGGGGGGGGSKGHSKSQLMRVLVSG